MLKRHTFLDAKVCLFARVYEHGSMSGARNAKLNTFPSKKVCVWSISRSIGALAESIRHYNQSIEIDFPRFPGKWVFVPRVRENPRKTVACHPPRTLFFGGGAGDAVPYFPGGAGDTVLYMRVVF